MKYSPIALSFVIASLAACNTSSTPFIDNCKIMVKYLANEQNVEWTSESKAQSQSGMLLVDLSFSGQTPKQTASCYFPAKNPNNDEIGNNGQYRGSPSIVRINGQQMSDEAIIKATMATVREFGKQNYEELSDKARDATDQISEKARKTALDAAIEVQKRLEKPAE